MVGRRTCLRDKLFPQNRIIGPSGPALEEAIGIGFGGTEGTVHSME